MRAGAAQGARHAPPGAAAGEPAAVLPTPAVGDGVEVRGAGGVLPVDAAAAAARRPRPPCGELYRRRLEPAGLRRRLSSQTGGGVANVEVGDKADTSQARAGGEQRHAGLPPAVPSAAVGDALLVKG